MSESPTGRVLLDIPDGFKAPRSERNRVKLAIVMLTKNPLGLETWLKHHRHTIGVEHFYLRVEEYDRVANILEKSCWKQCVKVERVQDHLSYFSLQKRQITFVNEAIRSARRDGVTHLIHIDDDELIHCPMGASVFRRCLSHMDASCLRMRNVEAVYSQSECVDPFRTTTLFETDPHKFAAYVNGKPIGNLSNKSINCVGPHIFSGNQEWMAPHVVTLLHFESSCIDRWRDKFARYAQQSPDACRNGEIPFKFYCDSMSDGSDETWISWKTPSNRKDLLSLRVLGPDV